MQPFTTLTAVAAPLDMANIDTDKIIPSRFLRKTRGPDYHRLMFHYLRFDENGNEKPEFVLNQPAYRNAKILVVGANFGCGSSREGAVYTMWDYGIRSVIAPSFADIHYANEIQNGMLPVVLPAAEVEALRRQLHEKPGSEITIELEAQTVRAPDGTVYRFDIDPVYKERLLKGLDDIALVLQNKDEIEAFEQRYRAERPWLAREAIARRAAP